MNYRKVKLLVAPLCPTFVTPMDCNPPGSSVHGISQARILQWVAISFSRVSSQPCTAGGFFTNSATSEVKLLSCVRLFATPWTVAYQASPSMGFSRQEYRSGLPFPSPGDLPEPGIEPGSPSLEADTLTSEPPEKISATRKNPNLESILNPCVRF